MSTVNQRSHLRVHGQARPRGLPRALLMSSGCPRPVPCLPFPPSACAKAIQTPGPSLALLPRPTDPLKWGPEAPWGFRFSLLHLNLCLTFSSSLWLSLLSCFPLSKSQLSVREIEHLLYVNLTL